MAAALSVMAAALVEGRAQLTPERKEAEYCSVLMEERMWEGCHTQSTSGGCLVRHGPCTKAIQPDVCQ